MKTPFSAEPPVGSALIPFLKCEGKPSVSARELYRFLELRPADFSRWCEGNIVGNPYAAENEDWMRLRTDAETPTGGKIDREDFALAIPFAKKLAMMSRSPKSEQVRDYFIECERRALVIPSAVLPQSYADALRALADTVEEKARLAATVAVLEPKAAFFDAVADSKTAIEMAAVAKVLDIPGIGRTKLFARLREKKVLRRDNSPYQEFIDRGLFRVIEQKWDDGKGETHISLKTLVFQKGLDFIRQLLADDLRSTISDRGADQ